MKVKMIDYDTNKIIHECDLHIDTIQLMLLTKQFINDSGEWDIVCSRVNIKHKEYFIEMDVLNCG